MRLELTGNGKTSNRDAMGAKVELKTGEMACHRQLFPSKSYLSSVEHAADVRPGQHDHADEFKITWPSGKVTTFSDLEGRIGRIGSMRKPGLH